MKTLLLAANFALFSVDVSEWQHSLSHEKTFRRLFNLLSGAFPGTSVWRRATMAASLRLGRQGILFGLKLSNLKKCAWATQPWQDHSRHFFLSPWSLGKCCHSNVKTAFVLVCVGGEQPQNDAVPAFDAAINRSLWLISLTFKNKLVIRWTRPSLNQLWV